MNNAYFISVPSGKMKPEKYWAPNAWAIFSKSTSENFPVLRRCEKADCDSPMRRPNSVLVIPAAMQAISIFCCIVIFIPPIYIVIGLNKEGSGI